jgi:hypothetical protein
MVEGVRRRLRLAGSAIAFGFLIVGLCTYSSTNDDTQLNKNSMWGSEENEALAQVGTRLALHRLALKLVKSKLDDSEESPASSEANLPEIPTDPDPETPAYERPSPNSSVPSAESVPLSPGPIQPASPEPANETAAAPTSEPEQPIIAQPEQPAEQTPEPADAESPASTVDAAQPVEIAPEERQTTPFCIGVNCGAPIAPESIEPPHPPPAVFCPQGDETEVKECPVRGTDSWQRGTHLLPLDFGPQYANGCLTLTCVSSARGQSFSDTVSDGLQWVWETMEAFVWWVVGGAQGDFEQTWQRFMQHPNKSTAVVPESQLHHVSWVRGCMYPLMSCRSALTAAKRMCRGDPHWRSIIQNFTCTGGTEKLDELQHSHEPGIGEILMCT